jgi:integrase
MAYIERKKNGSVKIIVSAGYDSAGKQIRPSKTIEAAELAGLTARQQEKEIERQKVLFEQKVQNGTYLDGEKISFGEFAEKWLVDYAEKQLAPGTLNKYRSRLRNRIIPGLGYIKIAKLQPHHLLEFYNNLGENGMRLDCYYKPTKWILSQFPNTKMSVAAKEIGIDAKTYSRAKNGERISLEASQKICAYLQADFSKSFTEDEKSKCLSGKTIKHHHDLISSVLSTAVEWNIITSNPAERVKPPKANKTKARYYDDKQVSELFEKLENEPLKYKTVIYFAIDTGLRISEIAGLEWKDINFESGTIEINKQRQYVSSFGIITKIPKTENGNRFLTVSATVLQMLKAYRVQQKKDRLKMGELWDLNDYVFIHEDGKPFYPNRPYQWFIRFLERNDLPKITFHQLRHTNASLLISADVDIVTLSGRLGHADKNVTLNTYSHIIKSKEKLAANKMDNFYSKISNNSPELAAKAE